MNQQTNNSNSVNPSSEPAHCRHRIRKGRYCQLPVLDASSGLCFRHSALRNQEADAGDLSSDLLGDVREFRSASDVHAFLAKLLCLLTQNRIAIRRAAVLAYITNQLLRTLAAIERETNSEDTTIIFDMPRPDRECIAPISDSTGRPCPTASRTSEKPS
jgi:hypothetical protein